MTLEEWLEQAAMHLAIAEKHTVPGGIIQEIQMHLFKAQEALLHAQIEKLKDEIKNS